MNLPAAQDFVLLIPELFLLGMICLLLIIDVFLRDDQREATYWLSQITLVITGLLVWFFAPPVRSIGFSGTFVADAFSVMLEIFVLGLTIAVFAYSRIYIRERGMFKGEYFILGLAGVLGTLVLISAHSLLTLYLGLELMSLAMYAMVAFRLDSGRASEAAMKYFVLGALASGMLLYGMSILYGITGSLDIGGIAGQLAQSAHPSIAIGLAVVFIVAGLAFKLGAVPFHMWVPDVYEGAPTSVTLYMASIGGIATFAMVIRLLAEALPQAHAQWGIMLELLVVLSLAVGNIIAIAQTSIKRMLAYSTIGHTGFIFLGVLAGTQIGYAASMFYVLVYGIMSAGGFGLLVLLSRNGIEVESLADLKGLNDRNPWMAFIMLLLIFSMAGIPPTVGFYAKLVVLQAILDVHLVWLAVYAVILSVIGAFYYLRVIKYMYFDKPEQAKPFPVDRQAAWAISLNGLAVLALGVLPGALMAYCTMAVSHL